MTEQEREELLRQVAKVEKAVLDLIDAQNKLRKTLNEGIPTREIPA